MHWKDKLTEKIEEIFYYVDYGYEGDVDIYIKPHYKWLEKLLDWIRYDL